MHHLALPSYCAVIVGLLMALLARAIYTGADSFVLVALVGIAYFGWHGWNDARRCWPAFRAEMERRRAARNRDSWKPPLRNPTCRPSRPVSMDDTH